jgi:hypothetical protein
VSATQRWSRAFAVALRRTAWAPLAVVAAHVVGGHLLDVYAWWPEYDMPMHFLGGAAIAYVLRAVLDAAAREELLGTPNALAHALLALGLAAAVTILWEFYEFLSDRWLGTNTQIDLADTLGDLLLGLLGALAYLLPTLGRDST